MGRALLADQDSGSGSLLENTYWDKICFREAVPKLFGTKDLGFMKDNFSRDRVGGDGFNYIYVHFISIIIIVTSTPTSDHQVLDLRG